MVLPESKLKPYINLVCNFIFIFIVISPIVGFFSSDESFEDKILKSMTDYNERYVSTTVGKACIMNGINEIDIFMYEEEIQKQVDIYICEDM